MYLDDDDQTIHTDSQKKELRIGGYCRLSRFEDKETLVSSSIENQKECISQFAKANNITLVDFYVDCDFTGQNFERDEIERLWDDIEAGKVDGFASKDACATSALKNYLCILTPLS